MDWGFSRSCECPGEENVKKILLGAVGLIAMATSASAADLAARPYTKAPVALPVIYNWSGFYIGANGGWAAATIAGIS
jgi:outer membrane immunogenic protein